MSTDQVLRRSPGRAHTGAVVNDKDGSAERWQASAGRPFPTLLDDENWERFKRDCRLTPRESDVLLLLTAGLGYEAICERLGVGRPTLRTHLRSAYQKVGCASRVELILLLVHEYILGNQGKDPSRGGSV